MNYPNVFLNIIFQFHTIVLQTHDNIVIKWNGNSKYQFFKVFRMRMWLMIFGVTFRTEVKAIFSPWFYYQRKPLESVTFCKNKFTKLMQKNIFTSIRI